MRGKSQSAEDRIERGAKLESPVRPILRRGAATLARRLLRATGWRAGFLVLLPSLILAPGSPAEDPLREQRPAALGPLRGEAKGDPLPDVRPLMVDALGDTLRPGPFAQRIISLSPSVTEILFSLGVDSSRVVGVTRFCDYPPEARSRPVVGGIVDPSLEEIVARRPDLVVAVRGNPVELLRRIRALGIPVFAFEDRVGLEGVAEILELAARLTGPEDSTASGSLCRRFREDLRFYRAWSDSIPPERKPTVYYADPEFPTWTAGPGSHVDDLISMSGGRNLVREPRSWLQYSAEELLARQPQVLLLAEPSGADREALRARLLTLPGWSGLAALRRGDICWIDSGVLLRPGPRLLQALHELAACLHPRGPRGNR